MGIDLGADGVEIDARSHIRPSELTQTGRRQLRKLLDDRNLRVCAISFRTRHGYNVRENLGRRVDATKDAMRMAYEVGANVVITANAGCLLQIAREARVQGEPLRVVHPMDLLDLSYRRQSLE